ncbi:peptide ligase PGM1-related protein [Spirillospora sp. NPDC050679]
MSTLLIGNPFNEHLIGDLTTLPPEARRAGGNGALRMAWLAGPGDVVVVAQDVDPEYLRYMLELKGLNPGSVTVLVPPPGPFGNDVLTRERLLHADFLEKVRRSVHDNGIDRVLPYSFDPTVAALARELDLQDGTPGFGFLDAGGHDLLNSKSVFRVLGTGLGLSLPEGVVTRSRAEAAAFAATMLSAGEPVIVKQDYNAAAHGNEILAPRPDVPQVGAPRLAVLGNRGEVTRHFDTAWPFYTNGGRDKVVVEHYLAGSVPLGSEFLITAGEVIERHVCEMRMEPVFSGIIIPGMETSPEVRRAFLDQARTLCEPIRAMGYRGLINIDGLAASDGRVLVGEFNGRLGGTTHLHWLGDHLVGPGYLDERLLVTRNRWSVPALDAVLSTLRAEELAFDPADRRGVVIMCDHTRASGAVEYCVVAEDAADARETEGRLTELFGPASR